MKFAKFMYAIVSLFIVFSMSSCDNGEATAIEGNEAAIEGNNSRVRIKLVDAPGTYDNVFVNIVDVQYNSSEDEEGWKSFPEPEGGYPDQLDLLDLVGGEYYLLADVVIESEMLKQIRIVLGDNNNIVVDGEGTHLTTPSAQQSGLKIKLDEELIPGFSYDYTLDFDVDKSIVKAGNSGKYILKPVINASSEVNSGSISGNVVGKPTIDDAAVLLEDVLVKVYMGDTYITSSSTNSSGEFLIQGLDPMENEYVLKIEHEGYEAYMSPEKITVKVGEVTPVGSIELLLQKSIVGKVIDSDGNVEGAMVDVFLVADPNVLLSSMLTGADGNFFFRGLAAGNYVLKIVGPDGDDDGTESDYKEYNTPVVDPPGDKTIAVIENTTTDVGNIVIEKLEL